LGEDCGSIDGVIAVGVAANALFMSSKIRKNKKWRMDKLDFEAKLEE